MEQRGYGLRCEVLAHSNDVRAVCVMDNAIISGSRDMTGKLWAEISGAYESCATLKGHSNYISSVCALGSSSNFPLGLILTGGHDHKIFGFLPYTQEPLLTLEGHSGPVCCLSPSLKTDFLISSSWDCTAKIWDVYGQNCIFTIFGHSQTIWSVINIPADYIVTGSADKTIKVFNSDLVNIHTLSGHSDCVRGLSYLHETLVISCSNDGTLRTWNVKDGSCLSVLELHTNYIYSVKAVFEKDLIVAGCEDKTLIIVYRGKQQNIVLPAQSIWTVDILPNLDIVTGSSDGYIRIFTNSVSRQASTKELEEFEKQLSGQESGTEQIDNANKLVHAEQVCDVGEFDGQLKFVTVLGRIKCFKWCLSDRQWLPIENVTNSEDSHVQDSLQEEKELNDCERLQKEVDEEPLISETSSDEEESFSSIFYSVPCQMKMMKSRGYYRGIYGDLSVQLSEEDLEEYFEAPCDAQFCMMQGKYILHCKICQRIYHTSCAFYPDHDYGTIICLKCKIPEDSDTDESD